MEQKKLDWFEDEIIKRVKAIGENDGVSKIIYLSNLNNTIRIINKSGVCTDVIAVYVGEDNKLSIWVSNTDDTHADLYYCGEVCDNLLSCLELNEFYEMFICVYIDGTEIIDPFCDLGCAEMKKVLDIMEVKY